MGRKRRFEASYAGLVYEKPVTHWTPAEEVRSRLTQVDFTKPGNTPAGGLPLISDGKTACLDAGDGHTALIAASGMKKTICGFMVLVYTLARAGENMLITDVKGELYQRTAGFLEEQGYNVLCLDFRDLDKDCFNILHYPAQVYRSGEPDRGLSLLSDLINVLAEDQRRHAKDPFWPDCGALWMNGTGAIMLDSYPELEQVNVLNWSDFNVRSSAELVEEHLLPELPDNTAKAGLRQCCSSAENTFRSILITASSFLTMFNQNPKLAAMLSYSTFHLEDLVRPKTALFLVTDDTTSTADPILGIIVSQIQSFLINRAYHSTGGRLATRMNFLLDEFASLPIPNMDKALATHRSRNIRYYLCVQSLALLKKRYDDPEALLSNCSSILYLGSTELSLLAQLETKLGKTRITPDGSERPLCSQAELMTLEKAWDHKEAIYMNLSEGIRFCTMLPSIEAYGIGNRPAPDYCSDPPEIHTYSVNQFVNDVVCGRISTPFAPVSDKQTVKESGNPPGKKHPVKEKKTSVSAEEKVSLKSIEEELRKKYHELFGQSDD